MQVPAPVGSTSTTGGVASKLFVGQVPAVCTEDMLRPLFAPYGDIIEIKVMRDATSGRSKGCAWVRYTTRAMGQAAIDALNDKHTIPPQTNTLQVRFAEDRHNGSAVAVAARTGATGGMNAGGASDTLFFGNLPAGTETEEFGAFVLSVLGAELTPKDIVVPRTKLFGFVTMHTAEQAYEAVQKLSGTEFGGQTLRVELARPRMAPQRPPPPPYAVPGGQYW